MPTKGQPIKTVMIPPKNAKDPFNLCLWKKNLIVRSLPITHPKPDKNNI